MLVGKPRVANFIIGGTEKAGTTSVFTYLSVHPQVCGATSKETDFFRQPLTGDLSRDLRNYARHFDLCRLSVPVVMEASPGYLGEAASVVPRMSAVLPGAKLLFILRDPVERLYSSYNFHVGKLDIAEDLSFEEYVDKCFAYDSHETNASELGMDEWYLKSMRAGRYADLLALYLSAFPRSNIKVMFFEQLSNDVACFMSDISSFLDIDPGFWEQYEFERANVTFTGSNRLLHQSAIYLNMKAEPFLRQRPKLKRSLVALYKKLNQARVGYDPMAEPVRERLYCYYRPHNDNLQKLLGVELPASWRFHAVAADTIR